MVTALTDLINQFKDRPEALKPVYEQALKLIEAQTPNFINNKKPIWLPNSGPQRRAYECVADELFYGGAAGGGKSSLGVGLAMTCHERSLILRRINKDVKKLAEAELLGKILKGNRDGWNGSDLVYRDGKRLIEFGGCEMESDKERYKGTPHDLIVFDEGSDFLESQYEFIKIWNRSTTPGQRCRVILTGNPPTQAAGLWVVKRWAAWLDPRHPNPAKHGEIRFYVMDDQDREIEVDGVGPHQVGDRTVCATSRTFIPAFLSDNPDLDADGEYERRLNMLRSDLRDAFASGIFKTEIDDVPQQLIPAAWVKAAQDRWTSSPPRGIPQCAIGVDCAQGGKDLNVLAPRHDGWFGELVKIPGKETPIGTDLLGPIMALRTDMSTIIIDAGGGYGTATYNKLLENNLKAELHKGQAESRDRSRCGVYRFYNRRAKVYYQFREALDPSQPGGSRIALPMDTQLFADLTSILFTEEKDGTGLMIKLEPKERLVKRSGKSPNEGDAVVMSWSHGLKIENAYNDWHSNANSKPKVIMRSWRKRT